MPKRKLTAVALKSTLWTLMNDVKNGKTQSAEAVAMTSSAREIVRTVRVQLQILEQARLKVNPELIAFATEPAEK